MRQSARNHAGVLQLLLLFISIISSIYGNGSLLTVTELANCIFIPSVLFITAIYAVLVDVVLNFLNLLVEAWVGTEIGIRHLLQVRRHIRRIATAVAKVLMAVTINSVVTTFPFNRKVSRCKFFQLDRENGVSVACCI